MFLMFLACQKEEPGPPALITDPVSEITYSGATSGGEITDDDEWTILTDFLGGEELAGGKLKETGIEHWNSPNTDATNETGFTALPGGYRSNGGQFYAVGNSGGWWTSSAKENMYVWLRRMSYNDGIVFRGAPNKNFGYSVCCIMD